MPTRHGWAMVVAAAAALVTGRVFGLMELFVVGVALVTAFALAVFVVVATIGPATPVVVHAVARKRAEHWLTDLKAWLMMKLLEDPYRDYDELLATFTDGFYGPAGSVIREYLDALEKACDAKGSYIAMSPGPSAFLSSSGPSIQKQGQA